MTKKIVWLGVVCVLFLAAILRIQAIGTTIIDAPVRADAQQYYFGSLNLARWGVFSNAAPAAAAPAPNAFMPPALPVLILPFLKYPPTDSMLLQFNMFQVCMGVMTVFLVFLLFRLFANSGIALGAALASAISPHLISLNTYLLTETSFTLFLMSGLVCTGYALKRDNLGLSLLGGVLFGVSALARQTTEYFPVFMLICMWPFLDRKQFIKTILPSALFALTVIVAWKIRNVFAIGALSDPTLAFKTIQHGMYPGLMYDNNPASFSIPYRFDPLADQMTNLHNVIAIIWQRVQANPGTYLYWYCIGKPLAFLQWGFQDGLAEIFVYPVVYSPYFDMPLFGYTYLLMKAIHIPLIVFSFIGGGLAVFRPDYLGMTRKESLPLLLVVGVIVYFLLLHIVGFPLARYSLPIRPCLYGLGVFTIVTAVRQLWAFGKCRLSRPD
jgi:4-amino-4-deoxy-L-arabinose transferase-like glycosyltransferase